MKFSPELGTNIRTIKTIESHTMGEPTRIVYEGFPTLPGQTMMEKKHYLVEHYDRLRTALMLEPRGHRDMFGAVLTEPVHENADVGVIFMDCGSYLNMCGHGSIGVATAMVAAGLVPAEEPYTEVALDAPSGLIRARVHVVDGKPVETSILNVPAFLYRQDVAVSLPGWGEIVCDISFGGSFFALVDADKLGLRLAMDNVEAVSELGMELLEKLNRSVSVRHPYLDITSIDLVEFYGKTETPGVDLRNCVIFGSAQADRSPCGTGTSAKLATLYAKGLLKLGQEFVYESITGTVFRGVATQEVEVAGYSAVIPQITGSAYLTGLAEWAIDPDDPLRDGFLMGRSRERAPESVRVRLVRSAWALFHEKGFAETSEADIQERAGVTEAEFHREFSCKDELEDTLGDFFDQKYQELVLSLSPRMSRYEQLLLLNQELFGLIENEVPFSLLSHVYLGAPQKREGLLSQNRFYYRLIPRIIAEGQRHGEFKTDRTPEQLAGLYATLERGMIYDWCVEGGKTSLREKARMLLSVYLRELLA